MADSDWSREEVEAIVSDYLDMLELVLSGARVNKAARNRELRKLLPRRSEGSVEYKHQNISAVLVELGFDYLDGYRPLPKVQGLLREVVRERVASRTTISSLLSEQVAAPASLHEPESHRLPELVRVPRSEERPRALREWRERTTGQVGINYHEREAKNRSLGNAGELSVMAFEHQRLWKAGRRRLADQVEHSSKVRGDGLGYDIRSFEEDGRERLIEVKTTRFAELTPFFLTRNELAVSEHRKESYQLYRLFRFDRAPKLFILKGFLGEVCRLEPEMYRAEVA